MISRALSVWLSGALLSTSCVSSRLDVPREHPANAAARTAPLQLASLLADTPAASPRRAPERLHDHASPSADTYTCPMHPEVERNAPGKCPICGMNLVKKSSPAPQERH